MDDDPVDEALATLREQAVGTLDMSGAGFADVVWHWKQDGQSLTFAQAWGAVVGAFQKLTANEWPYSSLAASGKTFAPVAYAVSGILSSSTGFAVTATEPTDRQSFAAFAWWV